MREDSDIELVQEACISKGLLGTRSHTRCRGYKDEPDTVSSPTGQGVEGLGRQASKEAIPEIVRSALVGTTTGTCQGLQATALGTHHPGQRLSVRS